MLKYSKLPGIRKLHDFIFTKNPPTEKVIAKIRNNCFEGKCTDAAIHVIRGNDIHANAIPDEDEENYATFRKLRELTDTKCKHITNVP